MQFVLFLFDVDTVNTLFNVMHVDTVDTMVQNIIHVMVQMSTLSIQTILVNLTILSLNPMKYTHWNCHCSCSLLYQQRDAI